ncbi:glycosyltransferase [Solirubrobacter ginsenosidimutans]|uniref:Glycosyltransferase n=1 Tax=Solirubrobacter ginsenosidimutans TaxID=490573 RepID=A0A9X3S1V6_9ACTN|nr:glycosyltransferase [Solirubrobacter ginsenosidimutans]MDA0160516.1 glycosyltransferase [Solirubrobacter ginsenosidimutans]
MKILIFHGYLLLGTGSNVYNAELGAALVRAGHEVHLLCQERSPFELEWVDAAGSWDSGSLELVTRSSPARATVYRPDLGGVLPVYVADVYEGISARPFNELSTGELDAYLSANVAAVREVAERVRPDVALANHLVMGPAILARALGDSVPYAVKIHGSALEYTVKPYPRFRPYAVEGLAGARGVLVGSRHTAESLWAEMDDPALPSRTRLGPPGVDIARFAPREPAAARAGLTALRDRLAAAAASAAPSAPRATAHSMPADEVEPDDLAAPVSSFTRDVREAVVALDTIEAGDRLIVFVGKLIASKGVELLLAALPLVLAREPRARLVVVGFGAFREGLQRLTAQLAAGDLAAAAQTRGEDGRELPQLAAFFAGLADADAYREAAADLTDRVAFAGRLDHAELADLLPAAEAMAVTSTFPEAFGMVAAEAAACGALPVVANHSGLGEVARTLAAAVPEAAHPWLSFDIGPEAVAQLAAALSGWLEAPEDLRAATRAAMVEATRARYSWDGVARTVIAAARGELEALQQPS